MKKICVADATDAALDWLVAKCEGWIYESEGVQPSFLHLHENGKSYYQKMPYAYSSDWAQGGPIIEREFIEITVVPCGHSKAYALTDVWVAMIGGGDMDDEASGPTPLIAAMRCYVASKLGDTAEVPEELV